LKVGLERLCRWALEYPVWVYNLPEPPLLLRWRIA
jgi:hypothetical protein